MEGCTGWRYVVEEIIAAGFEAHLAEPADTQAARGRKRHAKTDRTDARLLRELLAGGELPESWIPPECVLEWRERVRLYKTLVDQRTQWTQRIHAELFQHGVALPEGEIRSTETRAVLTDPAVAVSPAARQRIAVGYADDRRHRRRSAAAARPSWPASGHASPPAGPWSQAHFGIGGLTAVAIWSELGDCRRFSRSDAGGPPRRPRRHRGRLRPPPGRRPPVPTRAPHTLRWALYEAAKSSSRPASPDHAYYPSVKQRHDGKLAAIAMARKLARRCYHTLRSHRPRPGLRHALRPSPHPRHRRSGPPTPNIRISRLSAPAQVRARQHPCWTAF